MQTVDMLKFKTYDIKRKKVPETKFLHMLCFVLPQHPVLNFGLLVTNYDLLLHSVINDTAAQLRLETKWPSSEDRLPALNGVALVLRLIEERVPCS